MSQSEKQTKPKLDSDALEYINTILKSGKDVEVRRRGDGYIILEVTKKIKYST